MAEFTDKEIRAAYVDARKARAIARGCELPDQERIEHIKMTALWRWLNQRRDAAKNLSNPAVGIHTPYRSGGSHRGVSLSR